MKTQNAFLKTFAYVALFTSISWLLSFGFASLAGEKPYPKALFGHLEKRLNADVKETHESKTWPALNITKVAIESDSADVEIIAHTGADFKAELNGFVQGENPLTVAGSGNDLTVKVEGKRNMRWKFMGGPNIEANNTLRLKVYVPQGYHQDARAEAGSGDIKLSKLELKNLKLSAGSGDIRLEDVGAQDADIQSGSGELTLSGKIKIVSAKTGSGDISLGNLNSDSLNVTSGSGEIKLREISSPIVRAKTGSGDVTARLANIDNWTATARTGSGNIDSDFQGGQRSRHPEELRIGNGKNQLDIETGSGDINIRL